MTVHEEEEEEEENDDDNDDEKRKRPEREKTEEWCVKWFIPFKRYFMNTEITPL